VDVLSSRVLLSPSDLARSQRFYRDILGLAVYREFGPPDAPGLVFFLGGSFLELSQQSDGPAEKNLSLWLQVRDVEAEHRRLADANVTVTESPRLQPWGLIEMRIADPDGVPIILVEVPADHPLRRDPR
jgi:catechol 2,3-dioxygenase-like lactoylglutathione lyase family enzyme